MSIASEVHSILAANEIEAWLVDLRSVKPLDKITLHKLGKSCSHIFTLESNSRLGGVGASIAQELSTAKAKIINFGYPDQFVPHGKINELLDRIGFTAETISTDILQRFQK